MRHNQKSGSREVSKAVHRQIIGLFAGILALLIMIPSASAIDLFSVWLQGHSSAVAGDGPYFEATSIPVGGYGAELGLQILVLQIYADFTIMGQETAFIEQDGEMVEEDVFVHWNHLGFGPRIRIPLPSDNFDLYALANANFLNADYVVDERVVQNQAWQFRGGGGAEVRLLPILWLGIDAQVGYHLFEDSPGVDAQVRSFLRFRTTVHSGGAEDQEPGLLDPVPRPLAPVRPSVN